MEFNIEEPKITITKNKYVAYVNIPYNFAFLDSRTAVQRKIRRFAKKLKLRESYPDSLKYDVVNKKDEKRLNELLKYCNGKALKKTAKNNFGRSNAHR